ncbi:MULTISPECIES: low molecular weight phosphatase family protein [Myxococcus]|uniref:Arsenate reductase n=1 Tax=Myxococcus xanthus (strain DK1622) TaxID=246197 RepID=Q1DET0_MYXXD|nr:MULTISPECIES: arsenate reductase [Myxococcus]ABF88276.1 putative arsenate reductase [Myxococcus xanthus DK 1622]NOJ58165.1 arsenate reductase ArsC [Myxococcus xanthus]NOK00244.1 arsenate reductase ArsC [Myxococcus xanthus]QDE87946.1 arsenate reductase [Myxococcus xanthus]QPM80269.1 arsenate reductase ArsC [Myxococcus xanthus]
MNKVIFACVRNAGRSLMAEAFFNVMVDPQKARAVSAGTQPGDKVHPEVLAAMRDIGIDLHDVKPRLLTDDLTQDAQWLITLGCGEACPQVPGLQREDWPLEDPKDKSDVLVHRIRDELAARVAGLLEREGWMRAG